MKIVSLMAFILAVLVMVQVFGCGQNDFEKNRPALTGQTEPSKPDGLAVFRQNCVNCHGANGKLGLNGAKDLTRSGLSTEERVLVVTNGRNLMTPWKGILTPAEIESVSAYTSTLK